MAEYRGGNVIYNGVGGGSAGGGIDFTGISAHSAQNGRQSYIIPGSVIETSPGVYTPNTTALVANTGRAFWTLSDYAETQRAYVTSAAFWTASTVACPLSAHCFSTRLTSAACKAKPPSK